MEKHWKFTEHFAQRFVDRFDSTDVSEIVKFFNANVLQCIFTCLVRGAKQRSRIGRFTVCYVWDERIMKLVVTTVY